MDESLFIDEDSNRDYGYALKNFSKIIRDCLIDISLLLFANSSASLFESISPRAGHWRCSLFHPGELEYLPILYSVSAHEFVGVPL